MMGNILATTSHQLNSVGVSLCRFPSYFMTLGNREPRQNHVP